MKKIMILGANGMAGHILTLYFRKLKEHYDVLAIARSDSAIKPDKLLDVTNFVALGEMIKEYKPHFIINAVGLLNQEAEKSPDKAVLINSYLPHFLESITADSDSKIIHISTDCVFSGAKGEYKESDFKDGKGFYAQSKALGELINNKDLTIRTSIIGPEMNLKGIGLFHWFMNQKGSLNGFNNAIWTGVTTIELAKAVDATIKQNVVGLLHLVNNTIISKYNLLQSFKEVFNKPDIQIEQYESYRVDKSLINTSIAFNYKVPDYSTMIQEMKNWIHDNRGLYQYSF